VRQRKYQAKRTFREFSSILTPVDEEKHRRND